MNFPHPDFIKIVLIGDTNVGKTSIIHRFVNENFDVFQPNTVGVDFFAKKITIGGRTITVQIWDTAGQERFRAMVKTYFRSASAALIVFDVTKKHSFESIDSWLTEMKEDLDPDAPIILLGNKCDLENQRMIAEKTAEQYAESKAIQYYEVSAKNADGVQKVFNDAIEQIIKQYIEKTKGGWNKKQNESYRLDNSGLQVEKQMSSTRRGCC